MSRTVTLVDSGVEVRLTGWVRIGAFKGDLTIPYSAIRAVHAGGFHLPPGTWRLAGTSVPFTEINEGHFRNRRGWMFFSYEDADQTVSLELDGFKMGRRSYWLAVLGVDDPAAITAAIEAHCPNLQHSPQP